FAGVAGPSWTTSARRMIRPREPSRRVNGTTGGSAAPSMSPVYPSASRTFRSDIGSFFAENGSIEGDTTNVFAGSAHGGANEAREKTKAWTGSRYGLRKVQARSLHSFGRSRPTWQRQSTVLPASRSAG